MDEPADPGVFSPPMSDANPYAAPETDGLIGPLVAQPDNGERLWRDGGLLVMEKTASLPDRCVVCNEPASGRSLRRKLFWHAPGWYLLVLFNLIVYAIVAIAIRKKADIHIGLCELHRARRRTWMAVAWLLVLAAVILPVLLAMISADAGVVGMVLILPLIIVAGLIGVYGTRVVHARRIDNTFAWIGGVSPEFLAVLPEWAGPSRR